MSDVIRDALIRIRYEVQKSKLEGPELSQTVKSHEKVADSSQKIAQAHRDTASAAERAAEAHEDFGRRSFQAFAHAGHGVLQLSRGLALMSASGEEDTKKMLENLVKIEAAVSIAKGAGSLAKFAGEFGPIGVGVAALGATVAAGAAIWSHYHSEVTKAEEALKKVKEAQKTASEAERQAQQEQEQIRSKGRADLTDAERDPNRRRAAQDIEMRELQSALNDREELGRNTEAAISKAETAARKAELNLAKFDGSQDKSKDAMLDALTGRYTGPVGTREESTKEAARQHAAADELRKQRESQIQRDIEDLNRGKDVYEKQASDQEQAIRERERVRVEAIQSDMHPNEPMQKARMEMQVAQFEQEQRRLQGQIDETGLVPRGYEYGRSFEQTQTAGIHQSANADVYRVNEESAKAIKQVVAVLTNLNEELSKLKNAHPN